MRNRRNSTLMRDKLTPPQIIQKLNILNFRISCFRCYTTSMQISGTYDSILNRIESNLHKRVFNLRFVSMFEGETNEWDVMV